MKIKPSYIFASFLGLLALLIAAFYFYVQPYGLRFAEGQQLFLFNTAFLRDSLLHPGGAAEYISRFLTCFFRFPAAGALIIATLATLLALGLCSFCRQFSISSFWSILFLAPTAYYALLLVNDHYLITGLTALVLAVWGARAFCCINKYRGLFILPLAILVWMICGACVVVWIGLILLYLLVTKSRGFLWLALVTILSYISCFILADLLFPQLRFNWLFQGGQFFLYPNFPIGHFLLLWAVVIVSAILQKLPPMRRLYLPAILGAVMVCGSLWAFGKLHNPLKEEAYSYYVECRQANWEKVVEMGQKKSPESQYSSICLNLALARSGRLPENLFDYPQRELEGLIAANDFLYSGEVVYNLGMSNESAHAAYEYMMSRADHQYPVWQLCRLSQTAYMASDDALARKYFDILKDSPFYGDWEDRVKKDDFCNKLRENPLREDFYFDVSNFSEILKTLHNHYTQDIAIKDYYLCSLLLIKDIDGFYKAAESCGFPSNKLYKQAYAMLYALGKIPKEGLLPVVDNEVMKTLDSYIRSYESSRGRASALTSYRNTLWYYMNFGQTGR